MKKILETAALSGTILLSACGKIEQQEAVGAPVKAVVENVEAVVDCNELQDHAPINLSAPEEVKTAFSNIVECLRVGAIERKGEGFMNSLIQFVEAGNRFYPEMGAYFDKIDPRKSVLTHKDLVGLNAVLFESGYFIHWFENNPQYKFYALNPIDLKQDVGLQGIFGKQPTSTARVGISQQESLGKAGNGYMGTGVIYEKAISVYWEKTKVLTNGLSGWEDLTKQDLTTAVARNEGAHAILSGYYEIDSNHGRRTLDYPKLGNLELNDLHFHEFVSDAASLSENPALLPQLVFNLLQSLARFEDGGFGLRYQDGFDRINYLWTQQFLLTEIQKFEGVDMVISGLLDEGQALYERSLKMTSSEEIEALNEQLNLIYEAAVKEIIILISYEGASKIGDAYLKQVHAALPPTD